MSGVQIPPPLPKIYNYFIGNDFIDDYLFPKYTVVNNHWVNFKRIINDNGEILEKTKSDLYNEHFSEHYEGDENDKKLHNELISFIFHRDIDHFLKRNSIIYSMLKKYYKNQIALTINEQDKINQWTWQPWIIRDFNKNVWLNTAFNKNLQKINNFNKSMLKKEIPFLVSVLPTKWQIHNEILKKDFLKKDLFSITNKSINYFNNRDIKNIDLSRSLIKFRDENKSSLYNKNRLYYIDDGHWNELGQRIAAESAYDFIKKNFRID
jgi:lysophospholipase L1-like esterase